MDLKPKIGTYSVVCAEFVKPGFLSRTAARTWIKQIEEFGKCHEKHKIVVVSNVCQT